MKKYLNFIISLANLVYTRITYFKVLFSEYSTRVEEEGVSITLMSNTVNS